MGVTVRSVNLYAEKIRSESKRAKLETMDLELLQVMRFVFNDNDERSKETALEKWSEAELAGKPFTLNDALKIKETRLRLVQNMSTFRGRDSGRDGRGGGQGGKRTNGGRGATKETQMVQGVSVLYCFSCGQDGHSKFNCPRKGQAFTCKHHSGHQNHDTLACTTERRLKGLHIYNPRSTSRDPNSGQGRGGHHLPNQNLQVQPPGLEESIM